MYGNFRKTGIITCAGDVRDGDIFENVVELLEQYGNSYDLRKRKSVEMQKLVDGKGAARIAERLMEYSRGR